MYLKLLFSIVLLQFVIQDAVLGQNACRAISGQIGRCIELKTCSSLYQILRKNPLTPDDRQKLAQSQCGWQNNQPLVCCDENSNRNQPIQSLNILPRIGECGKQPQNRIVGGENTKLDEHPWTVLLEYRKYNGEQGFHCGGSLINERYVITAAHCIQSTPPAWRLVSVRLGEHSLNQNPDCDHYGDCADSHLNVPVEQVVVHEQYHASNPQQYNDIALIRLGQRVKYTDFIKPICLPSASDLKTRNLIGDRMEVVGWGKTETRSQSNVKLKVDVTGVGTSTCAAKYQPTRSIIETQICAGGERGKDSCQGDSGGGLYGAHKDSRGNFYVYLAGIVSYGPSPCGKEEFPGVYTRVSKYIDWIQRNIKP